MPTAEWPAVLLSLQNHQLNPGNMATLKKRKMKTISSLSSSISQIFTDTNFKFLAKVLFASIIIMSSYTSDWNVGDSVVFNLDVSLETFL